MLFGATSLAALGLAGCATTPQPLVVSQPVISPEILSMYGAMPLEQFPIPAARIDLIDPTSTWLGLYERQPRLPWPS